MSRPEYLNDPKEPDLAKRLKGSLQELIEEFNVNAWSEQPTYIEVWIEKEALSRIILPTCKNYNVNLLVGRGYSSASQLLKAIDRFPEGRRVLVLYLGTTILRGIISRRNSGLDSKSMRCGEAKPLACR